jgi:flagellar FliL protein
MQENHIDIRKSARYYTLGALNDNTSEVWFILHGYAQLAKDILHEATLPFGGGKSHEEPAPKPKKGKAKEEHAEFPVERVLFSSFIVQ